MGTIEQIKKDLQKLPDETLEELDQYIQQLRHRKAPRKTIPTFHLNGQYDEKPHRKLAYE